MVTTLLTRVGDGIVCATQYDILTSAEQLDVKIRIRFYKKIIIIIKYLRIALLKTCSMVVFSMSQR